MDDLLEKFEEVKKEFDEAKSDAKYFRQIQEKRLAEFWQTKKVFLAFVGVVFTMVFTQKSLFELSFGINFITIYLFFSSCALLLVIDGHWQGLKDISRTMNEQIIKTTSKNIRYAAIIEKNPDNRDKFYNYASDAESMLKSNHTITQEMLEDEPLKKIINDKIQKGREWKPSFWLWCFIFFSVPFLFLLKILEILR